MESPGYRVFVGGISWKADEVQLENFFSTHGQVLECKIIMDKGTGKSKGYGFVTFKDASAAEFVKQTANFNFLGKNMNVGDAVRKTPEYNGNHNGSSRAVHGNYGNGYQPFYNPNYYNRSNDTQFYGQYSPDGTFYPAPGYYYQQGFRGGNSPYGYVPNFSGPGYAGNFEEQPSSPDSPPNPSFSQNGFGGQFSPPNFNPYYYNPYYYPYNGANNGYGYGPGFNGGFNEGENGGQPTDQIVPSSQDTTTQPPQAKADVNIVNNLVNNTSNPTSQQDTTEADTTNQQQPATTAADSTTSIVSVPVASTPPPSDTSTSTSASSTSSTSFISASTSTSSPYEQGTSSYTRSPKAYAHSGIASPKQGVQQRSSPKPQQRQQPPPQPKQHKTHRTQDPSLVHSHVIAGLNKLSVSSN